MDSEIDLNTADRNVLIGIISQQQAIIEGLEKRVARLEGNAKPDASRRMPGLKPKENERPAQPEKPRRTRRHGFARTRMTPTQRVEHVMDVSATRRLFRTAPAPRGTGTSMEAYMQVGGNAAECHGMPRYWRPRIRSLFVSVNSNIAEWPVLSLPKGSP